MLPVKKLFLDWSAIRYILTGLFNTFLGLAIIFLAKWVLNWGDVSANLLGYGIGICVSFFINANWTFRFEGARVPAFLKFVFVLLVAYLLNLGTVMGAIHIFNLNSYLAQSLGVGPYLVAGYLGSRFIAFKQP